MSVKEYNKKRTAYINTVYRNLTVVKCKPPGYVTNAAIYDCVNRNRVKYNLEKEMDMLVKICNFEKGLIEPTYSELKEMVAGAKKAEQFYKQHIIDLKLEEIEKDFV
jgi:hypothetical protein